MPYHRTTGCRSPVKRRVLGSTIACTLLLNLRIFLQSAAFSLVPKPQLRTSVGKRYRSYFCDLVENEISAARKQFEARYVKGKSDKMLLGEGLAVVGVKASQVVNEERTLLLRLPRKKSISKHLISEKIVSITLGDRHPRNDTSDTGAHFMGTILSSREINETVVLDIFVTECSKAPQQLFSRFYKIPQLPLEEQLEIFRDRSKSWRLDVQFSALPYERQLRAVNKLCTEGEYGANFFFESFERSNLTKTEMASMQTEIEATNLVNAEIASMQEETEAANQVDVLSDERASLPLTRWGNPSQTSAILHSLGQRLSLIQGPPGTGKTQTACKLLRCSTLLKAKKPNFLATACSNEATDNILDGLAPMNLKVVRLGRSAHPHLRKFGLRWQARQTDRVKAASDRILKARRAKKAAHKEGLQGLELRPFFEQIIQEWKNWRSCLKAACLYIIKQADGVVSTCSAAGDTMLDDFSFQLVLIDEASQASEPEAMIPLTRGMPEGQLPEPELQEEIFFVNNTAEDEYFIEVVNEMVKPQNKNDVTVAVDAEWFTDDYPLSLLQLAVAREGSPTEIFLIDMQRMWKHKKKLLNLYHACMLLLEDFPKLLIFSPEEDLIRLQKVFPNLKQTEHWRDLQREDWGLGERPGLAKVVRNNLGFSVAKQQQSSDWGRRPLSKEQLDYAALDVKVLIMLHRHLYPSDETSEGTLETIEGAEMRFSGHAVLVGDQNQLPPVFLADTPQDSLFQRLINLGLPFKLLSTQYRMHPTICDFISKQFYEEKLISGVSAEDRSPPPGLEAMQFVEVPDAFQGKQGRSTSWVNPREADEVERHLTELLSRGSLSQTDVGVITPYAAQVELLQQKFEKSFPDVEVKSVDGFQGREKEVILLSTVRSSGVGFLKDWRRLNVAVSRAKRHVVVFGRARTLAQNRHWCALLQHIMKYGKFQGPSNAKNMLQASTQRKQKQLSSTNRASQHAGRKLPRGLKWIKGQRVQFKSVGGSGEEPTTAGSIQNLPEAQMLANTLQSLLATGDVKAADVGVITWYPGQLELLKESRLLRQAPEVEVVHQPRDQHPDLSGKKSVLLLSSVRSMEPVSPKTAMDRLRKALKYASSGLVVFGSEQTMLHLACKALLVKTTK